MSRARAVLRGLRRLYPDAECELDFRGPLELAVAVILSAQCTDKRVNIVTKDLFRKYRKAEDYARAPLSELRRRIRSTGFYRSKALSIREMARALVREHGGRVPADMEALLRLRGVARKTANVILGAAFGKAEGVVVDTHVKRVSFRLGLTKEKDPVRVEKDLMRLFARKDWIFLGHALVWHGRRVCAARKPDCGGCSLRKSCPRRGV